MTSLGGTSLASTIPARFARPAEKKAFFTDKELFELRALEGRELPEVGKPGESCKLNLFFGFFFDGTKNNYIDADVGQNHSNVARLYDCFPGRSVEGVKRNPAEWEYEKEAFNNFFRVYVPGVSSAFPEVGDSGKGKQEMAGGAAGLYGAQRITWGMLQAINNVHRFFLKRPLISPDEAFDLVSSIVLTKEHRAAFFDGDIHKYDRVATTRTQFEDLLVALHVAIRNFMPGKNGAKPKTVGPGMVKSIHMSTFGFSRGATQARAFQNWMITLCKYDAMLSGSAHEMTLGGFPVVFDFLGIYDTVASVGLGNSAGNVPVLRFFDGHGAWADAESSLRIPGEVKQCLHLVAAHELRRSFPLDSASVDSKLPSNTREIVFPGVHSDVGCGYAPQEQGKGIETSGTDMLARVPLAVMYRAARLAGVPLKLEFASAIAKKRFVIEPKTIEDFNNYILASRVKTGTITAIMRDQARMQMEWRLSRRIGGPTPIQKTAFYARGNMLDRNDFFSAATEFEAEIKKFEAYVKDEDAEVQPKGFDNDPEDEWLEIATWYKPHPKVSAAVSKMFDDYVHDSRAWFKIIPGNPSSMKEVDVQLRQWIAKRKKFDQLHAETLKLKAANKGKDPREPKWNPMWKPPEEKYRLTAAERKAANEYEASDCKKVPYMINTGREPFEYWNRAGYLRYRKIYGGKDSILLSQVPVEGRGKLMPEVQSA